MNNRYDEVLVICQSQANQLRLLYNYSLADLSAYPNNVKRRQCRAAKPPAGRVQRLLRAKVSVLRSYGGIVYHYYGFSGGGSAKLPAAQKQPI